MKAISIPVCLGGVRVVMACLGKHTTICESAEGLATHWAHSGLHVGNRAWINNKTIFYPSVFGEGVGEGCHGMSGKAYHKIWIAEGLATHWAHSELHVGNRHWTMSKREVFTITQPIFCKVLKCRLWLAQNRFYTYFAHSRNSEFSSKLPHTLSEGGSGKGWQGFPPTNGSTDRQRGQYRLRVEESSLPFYSTFKFNKRGLLNSYSK